MTATKTKKLTHQELVIAFRLAKAEAALADPQEDGGTCNFDAPFFPLKGYQTKQLEAAAEEAGVSVYFCRWMGSQHCYLGGVSNGQGARRTVMAEAATEALRAAGLATASTYYRMD